MRRLLLLTLLLPAMAIACSPESATTAPPGALSATPAPVSGGKVYVTRTGAKYHRASCRYAKNASSMALSEAVKRYAPCKVCKP